MSGNEALSPEPSDPQERVDHNLPPKSYAAATKESSDQGPGHTGGSIERSVTPQSDGSTNGKPVGNGSLLSPESSHRKSSRRSLDEKKLIYERYATDDGDGLTSVEPENDYQDGLRHNEDTRPRDRSRSRQRGEEGPQLATGRRAGAGWERSA